jgi:hypothetical protein
MLEGAVGSMQMLQLGLKMLLTLMRMAMVSCFSVNFVTFERTSYRQLVPMGSP